LPELFKHAIEFGITVHEVCEYHKYINKRVTNLFLFVLILKTHHIHNNNKSKNDNENTIFVILRHNPSLAPGVAV
jgi:hypothetical protein